MARLAVDESALQVAWSIASADTASARVLRDRLDAGQEARLFNLMSLDFRDGEACAVLVPEAPLEDIAGVIWSTGLHPVGLSLANRPEPGFRGRLRRRV